MESERDPLRKIPTKHAPEARADIGKALREAREKRGQTLEAVSQQTRISRRYLEALEKSRFDEFPALAYLRGFLKSYCDYLELEFEPLWRLATAAAEPQPTAPPAASAPKPQAPAASKPKTVTPAANVHPKGGGHGGPSGLDAAHHAEAKSHDELAQASGGAAAAVAALCALMIGSAIWLVRRPARGSAAAPAPALPAALAPVRAPSQNRVTLELRDDAWISVAVDGKLLFEGRAPKASRQDWAMTKSLALKAVNPDAVRVTLNGAPFKLPNPDAQGVYHIETP